MSHADGVRRHRARVAKHTANVRRKKMHGRHLKLVGLTNIVKRAKISHAVKATRKPK